MASDEDALTAMLDRDQRSFRRILVAGVAMVVVVMLIGGVLAGQNIRAAQRLAVMAENLEQANENIKNVEQKARLEAHRLRQQADNAAIADSRRAQENRAAYEDMRRLIEASASAGAIANASPTLALQAASAYLEGRRLDLVGERTIRTVVEAGAANAPTRDLLTAVEQMRRYDKAGAQLRQRADGSSELTPELDDAAKRLDTAAASPALKNAAVLGRARIDYILASANNFNRGLCETMFRRANAIPRASWSIPLLLNRAECWRKNGDSRKANDEFNLAVRRLGSIAASADQTLSGSEADPLVQYQAYHGRGTTLIAITPEGAGEADAMKRAQSDLLNAARLRKLGYQSELEVVGSLENLGLAYLHGGEYKAAAENAAAVARVRVLGWNEMVRAIAAGELKDAATEAAARTNLEDFRRAEFNECELKRLVGPRNVARLLDLLKVTRDGATAAVCEAATPEPAKT